MNPLLKIDGRTVRGRKWKDWSASGVPLKQGALLSKKMCSQCKTSPDLEKEVIECMCCHVHFHLPCLLEPLPKSFLETVSSNPSIYWFCPGCLTCKSNHESPAGDLTDVDNASNLIPTDVVLKSTLLSFKKEILTLVGETIENKFKGFTGLVENTQHLRSNNSHMQDNKLIKLPTYANMASAIQKNDGLENTDMHSNPPKDEKRSKTSEKHVLILEPTEGIETTSELVAKPPSLSLINDAIDGVNVDFCSVKKSGRIAIGFQSAESLKAAKKRLNEDDNCSSAFTTRAPKKMMPKVTVHGISEVLFENCGNRDEMCETLVNDIVRRNASIKNIIDGNSTEFISVVVLQKKMINHNCVTYTAVLKMSCAVRKSIFDNGNRLYVSLRRCKVVDRFYVKQCYHCQQHGHVSDDCTVKKDDALPTCFYCSGSHPSSKCTSKQSERNHRCANCLKSRNPNLVQGANSHTAASSECPIMQSYVENLKRKNANWKEKNNA